ncbi:MAG: glycoside hydrolase domain-containing protein [Armatimonadota bacterium]
MRRTLLQLLAPAILSTIVGGEIGVRAQDDLVACYTFDEAEGDVARDISGNGFDGTIVGATRVPSPRGRALRFDGVGDHVDLGSPEGLRLSGDLTIEVWVRGELGGKQAGEHENGNWLFFGDSSHLAIHRNYNLRIDTYNKLRFEWADDTEYTQLTGDAGFLDGEWHHVVAVAESPSHAYLYLDGRLYERGPMALPITPTSGESFRIGGWFAGVFPGEVDEVRLYSRALSTSEIARHAGLPPADEPRLSMDAGYSYASRGFVARVFCEDFPDAATRLEITVMDEADREVISETLPAARQTRPGSGRWWVDLLLPHAQIQAGDYALRCAVTDAEGTALASLTQTVPCVEPPYWLGADIGLSRQVPAPFEPLRAEQGADAVEVLPWNRRMVFDTRPFISGIENGGEQVLARPMALQVETAAGRVDFACDPPRIEESADDRVVLGREADGGALRLREDWMIEYDGFARVDWTLRAGEAVELQSMTLEIPLRPEHAAFKHTWPGRLHGSLGEPVAMPFRPVVVLCDEDRALCWTAESDQNWLVEHHERAMEIIPGEEETLLRLNIIGRPVALAGGETLDYSFGLIATPVRPMTRTMWEMRIQRQQPYAHEYEWIDQEIDGKPALQHFAELGARGLVIWRWWNAFSHALPVGHEERFPELVEAMHRHGLQVDPYAIGFLFSTRAPEFAYFAHDMLIEPRGEWFIDRLPGLENQMTYRACRRGPWQDWAVAMTAECMDRYHTEGVYLDGTSHPFPCRNELHGCGFTRRDGTVGSTYPVFACRLLMKRLYSVVTARRPDGLVDAHTSGCYNLPALAFATDYWNGEHLPRSDHVLDAVPLDVFRAEFMGRNLGIPADFLYYRLGGYRRCLGLSMLHDVPTRAENLADLELLSEVWRVREEFGCDGPGAEAQFVGYWELGGLASAEPEGAYVSLWRHSDNGLLALFDNLGREDTTVEVAFDLDALGIAEASAADAISGEPLKMQEGAVSLQLASQDWRLVWLRPE